LNAEFVIKELNLAEIQKPTTKSKIINEHKDEHLEN